MIYRTRDGEIELEIKPCPFCGKDAHLSTWEVRNHEIHGGIKCQACKVMMSVQDPTKSRRESDVTLIGLWNQRFQEIMEVDDGRN
ncbi:MAG: Lar family restriction alleviation protein [Dehalococcoidia bacterium]|nr:Lar family restriction alleviation protein [Dehalococcoidia bacterium]